MEILTPMNTTCQSSGQSRHGVFHFGGVSGALCALIAAGLVCQIEAQPVQMTPGTVYTSVPFKDSMNEMVARDAVQGLAAGVDSTLIEAPRGDFAPPAEGKDAGQVSIGNGPGAVAPSAAQTLATNFETIGLINAIQGFIPPDTCGAVGPNHFVEIINGSVAIYTRAGVLLSNVNPNTFFAATFAAVNYPRLGSFDPRVIFDRRSGRWMAVILERGAVSGQQNEVILAVSATSDPTGVWNKYLIVVGQPTVGADTFFTDYDTLGTDDNGVYVGVRIFKSTSGVSVSSNATIAAVPKAQVLVAGPATVSTFPAITDMFSTPQPAHNQDAVGVSGRAWFVASSSATFSNLRYRNLTWSGPVPTLDAVSTTLTTPAFAAVLNAPASGSATAINAGDARLQMAVIRNNSLWTCRNIGVNSTGGSTSANRTGCEWLHLNVSAAAATLTQSGRVFDGAAATPFSYFYPSIMVNGQGHAVMGFSGVQSTGFVGAFFTGRLNGDGTGTMGTVDIIKAGEASYQQLDSSGRNRWGDYSYTSLDPNDDMSIWTIQEYAESVAANRWGTWVAKTLAPPPATPVTCSPATVSPGLASVNVTVTGTQVSGSGFYDPGAGYLNRIAGALSGGVTVNSIIYNSPTSVTLNLNTTAAAAGVKDVTITNPDGQARTGVGILSVVSSSVVVPNANETVEGAGANVFPFGISPAGRLRMRYQQVYAAGQFGAAGPITITHLAFRRDSVAASFSSSLPDVQIELMTTPATIASMSTTFAANRGADAVVVYPRGSLALASSGSGTPRPLEILIPLTTPFVYNPASGNLLMEVRNYGAGTTGAFDTVSDPATVGRLFDNTDGDPNTVATGIVNGSGASPTTGLVTKFTFFGGGPPPPPAPVASALGSVVTNEFAPNGTGVNDGTKFDVLKRGGFLAENGHLVLPGNLLTGVGGVTLVPNTSMGLWKDGGSGLKRLARSGEAAPEALSALFDVLPNVPAINDSGEVTFLASLAVGSGSPATTANNDTGLWSELGSTGLGILLREDDQIPGLPVGTKVGAFGSGAFATAHTSATTGEAAFSVTLRGTSTDTAILRTSIAGAAVTAVGVVARENTTMPGTGELFGNLAGSYSDPAHMDAAGNLVFAALSKTTNRESVWYQPAAPAGTPPVKVFMVGTAVTGDTAPGTSGATFLSIKNPTIGSNGVITFRGFLNTNGDNTSNQKNDGIWRGSVADGFTCILRRGDTGLPGMPPPPPLPALPAKVGNLWHSWLTNANHGAWISWLDVDGNGTSAAPTDVYSIFTDLSGAMAMIMKVGDVAIGTGGATFATIDLPVVGGQEQLAFIGKVIGGGVTAANNQGIWRSAPNGGALSLVLRTGDVISTTQGSKTVQKVDFPGSASTSRRWEQPVMDSTGRMIVFVTFTDGSTSQVLIPSASPPPPP